MLFVFCYFLFLYARWLVGWFVRSFVSSVSRSVCLSVCLSVVQLLIRLSARPFPRFVAPLYHSSPPSSFGPSLSRLNSAGSKVT